MQSQTVKFDPKAHKLSIETVKTNEHGIMVSIGEFKVPGQNIGAPALGLGPENPALKPHAFYKLEILDDNVILSGPTILIEGLELSAERKIAIDKNDKLTPSLFKKDIIIELVKLFEKELKEHEEFGLTLGTRASIEFTDPISGNSSPRP
jgi:hypothetical protein